MKGVKQMEGSSNEFICVQSCPKEHMALNGVCYPSQEKELVNFLERLSLQTEWSEANLPKIMPLFILFVFSTSFFLLTISYLLPRIFQRFLIILALLALIYLSLLMTNILQTPNFLQLVTQNFPLIPHYIYWGLVGLVTIGLFLWISCFSSEIHWNGLLLESACKILPQRMVFIVFIIYYYLKLTIITSIFAIQCYAFNHSSSLLNSWAATPSLTILPILNILEYLWNIQYIKDTLYFSLSHLANSFYFYKEIDCCTHTTLACLHNGSLSAGSFLGIVFYIPNCLLDIVCCYPQEKRENCGLCCTSLTGLARTDAYAYQSLTAIPYCNSSRQSRRLSNESIFFKGVNSPLSTFRLFLHIFVNSVCLCFGIILARIHHIQISVWGLLILLLVSESLISGLIDALINLGQSLQNAILVDNAISQQKQGIYLQNNLLQGQLKEYIEGHGSMIQ